MAEPALPDKAQALGQPAVYPVPSASQASAAPSVTSALPGQYVRAGATGEDLHETDETAAVNAHLENWAEAEHKRRKSVRHARRAEAIGEVTNLGPIRRMSTRRRQGQPRREGSVNSTANSASADATPQYLQPTMARADEEGDLVDKAAPSLANSPAQSTGAHTDSLTPSNPKPRAASVGDHREVDMTRKPRGTRTGSNLGPNGSTPSSEGNKPRPSGARPIVTAGPAPVRSMWVKEAATAAAASEDAELTPQEQEQKEEIAKELAQEEKRKKRGFWLTDLLCCNFGSSQDDEQAAKTNPNE